MASLLVTGEEATDIVGRLFFAGDDRPLGDFPFGRVVYGRWQSSERGEELVVCRRDARCVEIHCHGGDAASAGILASLNRLGCQTVSWQEWVLQSVDDPIGAAARIVLAAATTERAAAILWDQFTGALRCAVEQVISHLADGNGPTAVRAHRIVACVRPRRRAICWNLGKSCWLELRTSARAA